MEIQDLGRVLWRRKWIIIIVPVITALLTLFLLQYKKDEYKSTSRIATGFTVTDQVDLADGPPRLMEADVKFNNLLKLMNSPISFNLLSYRLLLHDLDSSRQSFHTPRDVSALFEENKFQKLKLLISSKFSGIGDDEPLDVYDLHTQEEVEEVRAALTHRLNSLVPLAPGDPDFELIRRFLLEFGYGFEDVRDRTVFSRLPSSDFVEIAFFSTNTDLAAYAANAFTQEFIRYYHSLQGEYTMESVEFLKQVAAEKKAELDALMTKLQGFNSSDNLMNAEQGSISRMDQLVTLENQKNEIAAKLEELELTLSRLNQDLENAQAANTHNQGIVELQEKINELNTRYITGGATDKALADSLALLRGRLRTMINRIDGPASSLSSAEIRERIKDTDIQYQVEKNRLDLVNSNISELKYGFSNRESNETQISSLQNEVELATQEYLQVANKYNRAQNKLVSGNSLRQVLVATPALNPISMKNFYIVLLAALSSIALAFFVIILREVVDDSIKTPSRFSQMTKLPTVGALNKLDNQQLDLQHLFLGNTENKEIEMYKSSLRHIRHQIELMDSKIMLFTSLKPKVGKTFVIFSLAYVLSLLKKKVLIIDTNSKSSTLTHIYGRGMKEIKLIQRKMLPSRPFLTLVTQNGSWQRERNGEMHSEINAYDLVSQTKFKNIYFVGNKGFSNNSPAELLSNRDFSGYLSFMSHHFDYIFLEGPSLTDYSDTKELVEYAEKVIPVFSADHSVKPLDEHYLEYLRSLGGKLSGGILNKVEKQNMNF